MTNTSADFVMPSWLRRWEQFWFTPADPAILGLMRIACGMIAIYTFSIYTLNLQDFMGKHAWHDLKLLDLTRHNRPMTTGSLTWTAAGDLPAPVTEWQKEYRNRYRQRWKMDPPPPYPADGDHDMVDFLNRFVEEFHVDVRIAGAGLPKSEFEREYAIQYMRHWHVPPPKYAKDDEEDAMVNEYMQRLGTDPRTVYAKGTPVFSVWFDILDPDQMMALHLVFVVITILFTIGFCTRFTTALTWFGSLCYIHRNPSVLFGVDTMMTIVLLYLLIGPSGAAFSVDNLIRRWWRKAKPGVVQGWYAFWKRPIPALADIAPAADPAAPSVSANIALRLAQIHVCIIYLFAGLSKLQGQTWWTGDALWLTIGNGEFAPMQFEIYLKFLRLLGSQQWLFKGFTTIGGLFTLCFEIGYVFLIWRPKLRWVFLAGALILHGLIGLLMGLKTFSLMMLVMNMAFLRKEEALWVLNWFVPSAKDEAPVAAALAPAATPTLFGTEVATTSEGSLARANEKGWSGSIQTSTLNAPAQTLPAKELQIDDESYVTALERLLKGEKPGEVRKGLIEVGYNNRQADTILQKALQFKKAHETSNPADPEVLAAGVRNMVIGGLVCVIGTVVSLATLAAARTAGGGYYVVAWGAVLFGAIQFLRGLMQILRR